MRNTMSTHSRRLATGSGKEAGFTLVETLVALVLVLGVTTGMASLYSSSLQANNANSARVQLLSSVRAKIEQIQSIPYMQIGINASGTAAGPGYFVIDPVYEPEFNAANGDLPFADTVTLANGTQVTRTVTVTAVDDTADGVGANDLDGVEDANTGVILDYKLVTVTATLSRGATVFSQELSTIVRGSLAEEMEGATGQDSDGSDPPPVQKVAKMPPAAPDPPAGCEIAAAPKGKAVGKKGASKQSGC
jgi:type II secretory pathway pseudopilin PulG